MSLFAIGTHRANPTGATQKIRLPKARLATYSPASKVERTPQTISVTQATAGLVGEFLDLPQNQPEIVKAGLFDFGGRSSKSTRRRVYNAAIDAPSHVTYKNGDAHVFGHRTWTPATKKGKYPGYNSCARVASAMLMKAGVDVGMNNRVKTIERKLQRKGWRSVKVDDIKKGDVVIWKHEKGANHMGVYVGIRPNLHRGIGQTTVDNFSFTGEPEFRALHREFEWKWRIRKILRAPS